MGKWLDLARSIKDSCANSVISVISSDISPIGTNGTNGSGNTFVSLEERKQKKRTRAECLVAAKWIVESVVKNRWATCDRERTANAATFDDLRAVVRESGHESRIEYLIQRIDSYENEVNK